LMIAIIVPALAFGMMVTEKAEFKVSGNCGMCKTRIEKAAKINGVSSAEWTAQTKVLTLQYDPQKVKLDDVHKKIAAVGHDTDKTRATDAAYNRLHGCCKYDRTALSTATGNQEQKKGCCSN
jgi:periplasmic mercuric ion binding protein